jgi:hypothetical protein
MPTEKPPKDQTEGDSLIGDPLEARAEAVDLDPAQLSGSLRDAVLDLFRHRPKAWAQMTEAEQRDVSYSVERAVNGLVEKAVAIIAADERPFIEARLEKFTAKAGKYQAALVAQGGPELAADLARLDGHEVLIISADAGQYTRADPAQTDPDEPPLEFGEPDELPDHDPETGELGDEE